MSLVKVTVRGWNDLNLDFDNLPDNFVKLKSKSGLTGTLTEYLNKVFYDCDTLGIEAEFVARTSDEDCNDITIWKINNPEHRTMFLLRFA